jgi:hypothetical protein
MQARFLPFLLILFTTCEPRDIAQIDQPKFFDLRGLLEEHIHLLDSLNPFLHKVAFLENKVDTAVFRPDSAAWGRELEIFFELDINRPVLWDKYSETRQYDSIADRKVINYELIDNSGSGVRLLNIYIQGGQVMQIQGEYQERSLLYDAFRTLSINFDPRTIGNRILSYSIKGRQKMILQDTVYYQVISDIVY